MGCEAGLRACVALAVLLAGTPAFAGDGIARRIEAGRQAIATPAGRAWDAALTPHIQAAMQACAPRDAPGAHLGSFVLVGDVDASGRISDVAVEPASPVARCFARRFAAGALPAPPSAPGGAYPALVEMTVTP